uniref:Cytochrome P450 82F2 n=1 Tax=Isatis tinctoria TaxID=161756 RepID=A0A8F0FT09_ISATI|nr:cytochrome P450 82F2 [Isatis tinctoria]
MDLIQLLLLSALFLFSVSYFLTKLLIYPKNKKRLAPMAAGAWPFIGHLRAFDNGHPTHVTFGALADVYGPVFMTKLGSRNTLIINSQDVAKEIFTVHAKFWNRPVITASKLLGYNGSFITFTTKRPYWEEMRKVAVSKILFTAVAEMQYSRAGEVDVAFRDLFRKWEQKGGPQNGVLVDMRQELIDLVHNISLMMVAGKRYFGASPNCEIEEARRCKKMLQDFIHYFEIFLFSDWAPRFSWLDWKIKRGMKRNAGELDKVVEGWVEEHKKKRKDSGGGGREKNYLDRLIEIFEQDKNPGLDDAHTITKALCLNLVLAGPEATTAVLIWAVSVLVNNPDVLRKAQEEINRTVGKDRVVKESDLKDLVYLHAVIKETFRLYPPVTLTVSREVTEDFDIANGNIHVPAGTLLLHNVWKIQRDPSLWSNPENFEPERFLTSDREVDFGGKTYKFFPFGLGRRACPAIPLGMRMVQYILARFLQSFDVARPSSQDVDMTGNSGAVNLKTTPLELFITPRLPRSLYQMD